MRALVQPNSPQFAPSYLGAPGEHREIIESELSPTARTDGEVLRRAIELGISAHWAEEVHLHCSQKYSRFLTEFPGGTK